MKKTMLVCLIAAASFACGDKKEATSVASTAATPAAASATNAGLPANHPPIATASTAPQAQAAPAQAQPPVAARVTGKVVDTMDAGGYTYLKLKTASGDEWAAVRQTPIKKGATVTVAVQMTAEKFQSNTLKRTFDKIYFGALDDENAVVGNGLPPMMTSKGQQPASLAGAGAPQGMSSAMGGPMGSAQEHMAAPVVGNVSVPKAEGAEGKRIAEIWAARATLRDSTVAVRGKVTKFNSGIMGKNWLHIADGSGENDITVTTNDMAAVGDVVLVKGTVHIDRDFGAGYRYPVIIEEASVSK